MVTERITHRARLWRWSANGKGSWHFLTIDGAAGEALSATALMRRLELGRARGFGSLKVTVSTGASHWQTSVFPKSGSEEWMLPVKKAILIAEELCEGDEIEVALEPV